MHFSPVEGRVCGHSFLYDELDNGAGYSSHLAQPEVFTELLGAARQLQEEWNDESHAHCDTSCDACLRDYTNMSYHSLLDWRLASDMLALLEDAAAPLTLALHWNTLSLRRGIEGAMQQLHFQRLDGFGTSVFHRAARPATKRGATSLEERVVVLRHPLWQDSHPNWLEQSNAVQAHLGLSQNAISPLSPFRLIRRPSDSLR